MRRTEVSPLVERLILRNGVRCPLVLNAEQQGLYLA